MTMDLNRSLTSLHAVFVCRVEKRWLGSRGVTELHYAKHPDKPIQRTSDKY